MHEWIEVTPHPETRVEALMLEDFIAGLYGSRATWAYALSYDGKHLSFHFAVPKGMERSTSKTLTARFNRIVIASSRPLDPSGFKYYGELRLARSFAYPLFEFTRSIESNPVDVIASTMLGEKTLVLVIATPEPRANTVISGFAYEKKTGKPASFSRILVKEALSIAESMFSSSRPESTSYTVKPDLSEGELKLLREVEYKARQQLYAVRIMVFAESEQHVREVAGSFNQFPLNYFTLKALGETSEKIIREARALKPVRLGLVFKDKRLPVLSPRELSAYVNLPSSLHILPVKTAAVIVEPPPELPVVEESRGEGSVEGRAKRRGTAHNGISRSR